jgi:hypothetical protein
MREYRRFADAENDLASDWSTRAQSLDPWVRGAHVGTGESQSIHVSRPDGVRAIAKPAFQKGTDVPRAAHEKIASDLAHALGIPVPPVLLWEDPNDSERFAISARAFRQPLTWDQAKPFLTPEFVSNAAPILAAGFVFHAWIGDSDHAGNVGNVLIDAESTPELPGLAFIDHAFSMTYEWKNVDGPCTALSSYYISRAEMPEDAIADAVLRVQTVSSEAIREIVGRIPAIYLPEPRATLIDECLRRRQALISATFGLD